MRYTNNTYGPMPQRGRALWPELPINQQFCHSQVAHDWRIDIGKGIVLDCRLCGIRWTVFRKLLRPVDVAQVWQHTLNKERQRQTDVLLQRRLHRHPNLQ